MGHERTTSVKALETLNYTTAKACPECFKTKKVST
jgi:hypothetical protein